MWPGQLERPNILESIIICIQISCFQSEGEGLDWAMMNDLLTQTDTEQITGPATDDDLLCLNQALANLDTGT